LSWTKLDADVYKTRFQWMLKWGKSHLRDWNKDWEGNHW